ncbi:MAG: ferric reductase-like transmembrane domain-containing protein [Phycisphaeraceae bacterium]|nr:ferric reductase-like transmembrane domain-containing protein [Phycisphaeraceae bacterium]
MTNAYQWVQWNRHKRVYDLALGVGCALFLGVFVGVSLATHRPPNAISPPILLIRGLAALAIVLLHIILCIGPLARLDDRFAPLLYNRRHLGVTYFCVALAHAALSVLYYGGFGVRNPASAMLDGYTTFGSISGFPFEILGFLALLIFFVMAATSHDFWLANLSARVWKTIHMSVYAAYTLVVLHVALGALQSERNPVYAGALLVGVALVATLHTVAGWREWRRDRHGAAPTDGWIDAGDAASLEINSGRVVVCATGERLAVFRTEQGVVAMTNVCAHQGGPLGEGRLVGGCVTCPWHGYQYLPENGQSPPPYTEKIPTHNARIVGGRIRVSATPNAPGTPTTPATPTNDDGSDA